MWQISSSDGVSWVRYDAGRLTTSADCARVTVDDGPVEVAPMSGMLYRPTGPGDQVAMFLRARSAVGWPQKVTGSPPAVPVPVSVPAGPNTVLN